MEQTTRRIRRHYRVKGFIFSGRMFTETVYAYTKQEAIDFCREKWGWYPITEFDAKSLGKVEL